MGVPKPIGAQFQGGVAFASILFISFLYSSAVKTLLTLPLGLTQYSTLFE